MKKVISYVLLIATMAIAMPYNILAETTDIGVNITGSVTIDVVTTISADITLDLSTGETTPTYMEVENNSNVPVSVKITDISAATPGAPSEFVGANDKDWKSLSQSETNMYVNFNILGSGQNVHPQDILEDTELELGVISERIGFGMTPPDTPSYIYFESNIPHLHIYKINANFGRNWSEGEKNFTYQITTVYSQADEYVEGNYTMPSTLSSVDNMYLNFYQDIDKTIMSLVFVTPENQVFESQIENVAIGVMVNNISVSQFADVEFGGASMEDAIYGMPFSIPKLESSPEGTTHYLNVRVTIDYQIYTFIEKVIVYSE